MADGLPQPRAGSRRRSQERRRSASRGSARRTGPETPPRAVEKTARACGRSATIWSGAPGGELTASRGAAQAPADHGPARDARGYPASAHDGQEEAASGRRRGAGPAGRGRRRVRPHTPPGGRLEPERRVRAEPTATEVPDEIPEEPEDGSKKVDPLRNFLWADYGYSKDRRKFLPASKLLRPPFWRVWSYTGVGPARVPAGDGRGQALPAQEQRRAARDRQAHRQARCGSASSACSPPPRPPTATAACS